MKEIFLQTVNMSITCAWIVLGILIARLLLKKAPKWISVALWGIVAIRLVLPFSLESIFSIIPSGKTIYTDVYISRPYIETGFTGVDRVINNDLVGIAGVTVEYNFYDKLMLALGIAWIVGIVIMLAYALISYLKIKRQVKISINTHDNVYICDAIETPFILGIIKPKIYLPSTITENKEYVIAHEKAHIKRGDHLWKPLGFLLLSIHWFNPMLWVAYILLCRDIESACDEAVLKRLNSEEKKLYSTALLSCATRQKLVSVCPLAFGEVGLKARIKSVLNYKKPAFWVIIFALIISIIACACLLTDPTSKLSDLDLGYTLDNAKSIEWLIGNNHSYTEDNNNIAEICNILKKVKITKNPISYNRSEDREKINTITFDEKIHLHFNSDFSEVWVDNGVKPSLTHAVKNPEILFQKFAKDIISTSSSELDGISLQITELNLTDEKPYIMVTFTRESSRLKISYGEPFNLYYFKDNEWIDTAVTEKVFSLIAYTPTEANLTFSHKYPLSLHDLSKQGRYKFETTIHKENDSKEYKIWAEFDLKEGYETSTVRTFSPRTCYYESGLYDPAYPPKDRSFKFINDNMLFEFSRGDDYWKPLGSVSEYTLTKENFDYIFEPKWQSVKWSPKALRESAKKVYKIDPQEENWYYILIEGEDDFYLGEFTKLGCMWFYSLDDVNVNPSFTATILEINEQTILVAPSEDSAEAKSYDKILVNADILTTKLDAAFKVGDNIRIVYNGTVLESYPPVINTIFNITKTK